MTTKKIYGPPIKWDGGECPVPPDTVVTAQLRSGEVLGPDRASAFTWNHIGGPGDIVSYSTTTEQPDLEAAEKLLRANGYTIIPPAKPLTFEDVTPMTEAPHQGTAYWAIRPFSKHGVTQLRWDGDDIDKCVLRHRMAYLNQEHALIAARHIFGLKGGEL